MSEPIKPALTAEEWEANKYSRGDAYIWRSWIEYGDMKKRHAARIANDEPNFRSLAVAEDHWRVYADSDTGHGGAELHAIAAFALYGQPFGFTREMLKGIRECADFTDGPEADLAREAADRIESLLPREGA